jgi:cytochrome c peroxidase
MPVSPPIAEVPSIDLKNGHGFAVGALTLALSLSALADPDRTPFYAERFALKPSAASLSRIGKLLFFDPRLSASGRTACASCHDPKHAYGPPNDAPVQRAGIDGRRAGVRAVPALRYAENSPPFTEHLVDDEGDDSIDQGPAGGRTWDGRAQSLHEQARLPLLSEFEMANANEQAVVAKIAAAPYAAQFRRTFGERIFADSALAFSAALLALETYQQEPQEFYPYSSKYDAYLRREVALSAQEQRGLEVFNDPKRGNCARCHPSSVRAGTLPAFTDFGFAALGVPRNRAIPANRDANYFDLGLCGPWRTDLTGRTEYCGLFRTPSLRNVARRTVFFHNGVFHRLKDAVRFYARRDTDPGAWYPPDHSRTGKFDDLPARFVKNVDTLSPFDRLPGAPPAMSDAEIEDVVAFLGTLTDGFEPAHAGAAGQ